MKLDEVRGRIKEYDPAELREIIVQIYKAIPKKIIEEKGIDAMIEDIKTAVALKKKPKIVYEPANVNYLEYDIDEFVDYAYKQYYFAPNSYVHKKDRPKWRFIVKKFINDLQTVSDEPDDNHKAGLLLEKLYKMLLYACKYYIFSTDDPFRSVGIAEEQILDMILERKLEKGLTRDSLSQAIRITAESRRNNGLLIARLKTPELREMAFEECLKLKRELEAKHPSTKIKGYSSDFSKYELMVKRNNFVDIAFRIRMDLFEYDEAIEFFKKNYFKGDQEVTLFILLDHLFQYDLRELWIREYENAVKNGIEPREELAKVYSYIKSKGEFPETYWRL
jgi:hypothetical protein